MKTDQTIRFQVTRRASRRRRRRGSTLLIVISLLGLLSLLGFLFYTFAAQERVNAENFAEGAKQVAEEPEEFFDFALEQLIVGPDPRFRQSALWGRRHSMMANLFGRDTQPHSGRGINVGSSGGQPFIDQDFDGAADPPRDLNGDGLIDETLLDFADSPAANFGFARPTTDIGRFPDSDVDYTYPDLNNLFLGYQGVALDPARNSIYGVGPDGQPGVAGTDDDGNGTADDASEIGWPGSDDVLLRVTIPSFHRPAYLRNGGVPIADWYENPTTARRVLRPHPQHVCIDGQTNAHRRFLDANNPAHAALIASLPGGSGGFPFRPPAAIAAAQDPARYGEMGVWTGSHPEVYELDVDNDGQAENGREGVWLDLDYPVLERTIDNAKYIPLASFTIYDVDSLLNLNIHGNIDRWNFASQFTGPAFPNTEFISQSNLGLSPAEVNPLWALRRDPATAAPPLVFNEHFGVAPTTRMEAANFEWVLLNAGRADTSNSDLIPGRWAEMNILYLACQPVLQGSGGMILTQLPRPGVSNTDDDNNSWEGERFAGQPAFGHPLDFRGIGQSVRVGTNGRQPDLRQPISGNPMVWPRYTRYKDDGTIQWRSAAGGTSSGLMMNSVTNSLIDDPMESIVDSEHHRRPFDEHFTADDLAFLQLTPTDLSNAGITSRLEKLLPYNFDTSAPGSQTTRGMFTTLSWDRKKLDLAGPDYGPDGRPGVANVDDDGNGLIDDAAELSWTGSDDGPRAWEFSADADVFVNQAGAINVQPDGHPEFPPQFGNAGQIPPYRPYDPYRPQLRRLLRTEVSDQKEVSSQVRLTINGLVDIRRWPNEDADDREDLVRVLTRPLEFRPLTPHPDPTALPTTAISSVNPSFPPTSAVEQEAWARRDRQKMARDIYVLLYTLGGGNDTLNYAATDNTYPGRPVYTDAQLRAMAQFAVNVVDALDRDRIVTKFEYDKNLANGWGDASAGWFLDDDPFAFPSEDTPLTSSDPNYDPAYPEDGQERGVVYGIEGQQLTLSEVLAIQADQVMDNTSGSPTPVNVNETAHDDRNDQYFSYIELRNASAFDVDLENDEWQIRMVPKDSTVGEERRFTILRTPSGNPVGPGGLFTLATTTDTTNNGVASFQADYTGGTMEQIIPRNGNTADFDTAAIVGTPSMSLTNYCLITDANGTDVTGQGTFLDSAAISDPNGQIEFQLLRRLNPDRPAPTSDVEERDNPWIIVDREILSTGLKRFVIPYPPQPSDMINALKLLTSRERPQPFDLAATVDFTDSTGTAVKMNSFMENNDSSPSAFTMWQPHFDRDFASTIELLGIPIYGPYSPPVGTGAATAADLPSVGVVPEKIASNGKLTAANTAGGGRFLVPDDPDNSGTPAEQLQRDNRWFRLLSVVEVPTRTHRELGNPVQIGRVPGKLNLNTIRYPEILAGLLDDSDVFTRDYSSPRRHLPGFDRDWWTQFLLSRDRVDPTTGYVLPGTAGARPFRGLSDFARGNASLDDNLLRSVPADISVPIPAARRRLFEVATQTDHANEDVDYYSRQRLLSKIFGNSTTRSNVFVVFVSIGFFECHETDDEDLNRNGRLDPGEDVNGNGILDAYRVQIGGQFDVDQDGDLQNDGHRGFFVIDRSDAESAYNPATGSFDWRKLVKYRLTLN